MEGGTTPSIGTLPVKPKFITGRNEVVAKVIFLHLSVIHSVHGGGLPQCMLGYHPPGVDPLGADPPGSRPSQGADPPPGPDTPPEQTPPGTTPQEQTPPPTRPPRKQTPAYGLRAAGTHPTGMHSCSFICFVCLFFSVCTNLFSSLRYAKNCETARENPRLCHDSAKRRRLSLLRL